MKPSEYLNPETRALLIFMRFRVVGMLHVELRTNPLTAQAYRLLLESNWDDQAFNVRTGHLLMENVSGTKSAGRIAPRLLTELVSILWAQVVDWLVEMSTCEYKNFGGFRANRAAGTVHVDFTPSPVVADNATPASLHSTYRAESLINELCYLAIVSAREELIMWTDFGSISDWRLPLIGTTVITRALDLAWMNVLANKEVVPELGTDAVEVFAMAASVVTYYAWAIAFGIELRTRSELNMQDIGLFRRSESQVEFTPASCFLSLLRANLPPLVKGLAA